MEATEFRINNLVKDQLTGEFMKISDLSENKISAEVIDRSKFPLPLGWKMIPIPLTEEILLKCGIIKIGEEWSHSDDEMMSVYKYGFFSIVLKCNEFRLWIGIEDDPFYSFSWTKIKYLHQLQNLYFALTGQELEINL